MKAMFASLLLLFSAGALHAQQEPPVFPPNPYNGQTVQANTERWLTGALHLPYVFLESNQTVRVLGYSSARRAIVLESVDSTDAVGGNPGIRYLLVDAVRGEVIEEVHGAFNIELRMQEGTEAEIMRLKAEVGELGDKADEVVRSWAPRSLLLPEGLDLLVIGDPPEDTELRLRKHIFVLWDRGTGWGRPFSLQALWTTGPHSLTAVEVLWEPEIGIICARLRTQGHMTLPGAELVFVIPPSFVAAFLNEVGFEHYQAGRYRAAEYGFRLAARFDPTLDKAVYNAACMLAIQGQPEGALHYLNQLAELGTPDALNRIDRVPHDSDYDPVREDSLFQAGLQSIYDRVR